MKKEKEFKLKKVKNTENRRDEKINIWTKREKSREELVVKGKKYCTNAYREKC